ncbi:MAG: hypothetical protein Q9165_003291 [Trypethelium subeluteriae]
MPSKSEDLVDEAPPSINPYEVLSLPHDASPSQIKTAYRRAALLHHPDKASPDAQAAAHTRFQEIAFAYAILSDPRRRSRYDTTGRTSESLSLDDDLDDFDWRSFYREQFAEVVTADAVAAFRAEYQGSEEERAAVLAAYAAAEGEWDAVYEEVMLSNPLEDEERFRAIIEEAIEQGEVRRFERYAKETTQRRKARMRKARAEEAEAMEMAEELGVKERLFGGGGGGEGPKGKGKGKGKKGKEGEEETGALAALIQSRQQSRGESFLANLEAKYAPKAKAKKAGKGKKRGSDEIDEEGDEVGEPPEEAFEEMGRRKGGKGKKGGNTDVQIEEELGTKKSSGRKSKKAKT